MKAQEHNRLLGILFLVLGALQVFSMLWCLLVLPIFLSESSPLGNDPNFPRAIFSAIILAAAGLNFLLGSLDLIAGYGIIKRKSWGRVAGIMAAVPSLISVPIGTALGVYTLWFMMGEKGKRFYLGGEDEGAYLPPPPPQFWKQT